MEAAWSGSLPVVVADETAEEPAPDDLPFGSAGDGTVRRGALQRSMRTPSVVVPDELGEGPAEVPFVQDDDVVQALVAH